MLLNAEVILYVSKYHSAIEPLATALYTNNVYSSIEAIDYNINIRLTEAVVNN